MPICYRFQFHNLVASRVSTSSSGLWRLPDVALPLRFLLPPFDLDERRTAGPTSIFIFHSTQFSIFNSAAMLLSTYFLPFAPFASDSASDFLSLI
jgi:hypothetical protein